MDIHQYISKIHANYLITKVFAPGRLNIIGEHTDYNQGFCLPAAIDLGINFQISTHPLQKWELFALDLEESYCFDSLDSLFDPPHWANYILSVIKGLSSFSILPCSISFYSNLPIGAGLSSSSALTCGFLAGLNKHFNLQMDSVQICHLSVQLEKQSGVEGGIMDQIAICFGKQGNALFLDCRSWQFEYVPIVLDQHSFLLIDTRVKHKLIDTDYNQRSRLCQTAIQQITAEYPYIHSARDLTKSLLSECKSLIGKDAFEKLSYVLEENERVTIVVKSIKQGDLKAVGQAMYASHEGLKNKYEVSCTELDILVDFARTKSYVKGARMMGGGFGGTTIHLVETSSVSQYIDDISIYYHHKTGIDCNVYHPHIHNGIEIK